MHLVMIRMCPQPSLMVDEIILYEDVICVENGASPCPDPDAVIAVGGNIAANDGIVFSITETYPVVVIGMDVAAGNGNCICCVDSYATSIL